MGARGISGGPWGLQAGGGWLGQGISWGWGVQPESESVEFLPFFPFLCADSATGFPVDTDWLLAGEWMAGNVPMPQEGYVHMPLPYPLFRCPPRPALLPQQLSPPALQLGQRTRAWILGGESTRG